ncbi:uncharacterized protein LOC106152739 [Lingula anatina]|uniref:Uncharacterized protein LOC106152739 n=1 Tax=Lingula anatina TaxID=7574 RepID=A0A1S3H7C6_LINAN|nr:uncharacterized protein LOC106152739 [Lingula anatina]|eukprot:XP_013381903.1 uncharacterized protein LOC106152739 [Lingula anatina]
MEVESQADEAVEDKHEDCPAESQKESTASQCDISTSSDTRESIMLYQQNAKAVQYLTGFSHFEHFMLFFNCLGPAAHCLNFKCLSPEDQCFLTIMHFDRFKLSVTTVSEIKRTWINFVFPAQ